MAEIKIVDIARVCHEANRSYCMALGDASQLPWDQAPQWQRDSCIAGVDAILVGKVKRPQDSHENWMRHKEAEGWKWGPRKDPEAKEHPCMVPHGQLPLEQQIKDELFFSIVQKLCPLLDVHECLERGYTNLMTR